MPQWRADSCESRVIQSSQGALWFQQQMRTEAFHDLQARWMDFSSKSLAYVAYVVTFFFVYEDEKTTAPQNNNIDI